MVTVGGLQFQYDRTRADVDQARALGQIRWVDMTPEQQEAWLSDLKGMFNRSDWDRITKDAKAIAAEIGVVYSDISISARGYPKNSDMMKLWDAVRRIRARYALVVHSTTPPAPTTYNNFGDVNSVEHILHDVHEIYLGNIDHYEYSGDGMYAGDSIGVI